MKNNPQPGIYPRRKAQTQKGHTKIYLVSVLEVDAQELQTELSLFFFYSDFPNCFAKLRSVKGQDAISLHGSLPNS